MTPFAQRALGESDGDQINLGLNACLRKGLCQGACWFPRHAGLHFAWRHIGAPVNTLPILASLIK